MSSPRLDELPELLTVDELASVLRVGRSTAYELIRSRTIPKVQGLGRIIRVHHAAVQRMLSGDAEPVTLRAVN